MDSTDEDTLISSCSKSPYPLLTRQYGNDVTNTPTTVLGDEEAQGTSRIQGQPLDANITTKGEIETSFSSEDTNGVCHRNPDGSDGSIENTLDSVAEADKCLLQNLAGYGANDPVQWTTATQKGALSQGRGGTTPSASQSNSQTKHPQKSIVVEDNPEAPIPKSEKLKFSEIPRRSKLTLMIMAVANFGAGCAFSLPAPFFPREAARKGASPTSTGIVFSSYELFTSLTTPIFGNFVSEIGPKFLYASGISVAGCCSVLFGFLDQCPGGVTFIVMSLLVRSVEAVGQAAFATASFAIVSAEFPNHISSVFSILETFIAIGLLTGPTLGGTLYELGGFGLPFWVTGVLIISTGVVFLGCLPPPKEAPGRRQGHILTLLKSPLVWVAMLLMIGGSLALGFMDPTLSLHLEKFHLSTLEVSLFFVIAPLLHALLAPFLGYLSDSMDTQAPMMIWACIACGSGFLMLGPTPLLPFLPKQIWFVTLGLVSFGLGIGCCIIPTMKCVVIGARELGFPDNISTFGMVSGLFNANFHFGAFIGPTVAGALVEQIGFEYSATVVAGVFLLSLLVTTSFFSFRRWRGARGGNPYINLDEENSKQSNEVNYSTNHVDLGHKQNQKSTQTTSEKTPLFQHNGNAPVSDHSPQDSPFSQCFTMSPCNFDRPS